MVDVDCSDRLLFLGLNISSTDSFERTVFEKNVVTNNRRVGDSNSFIIKVPSSYTLQMAEFEMTISSINLYSSEKEKLLPSTVPSSGLL